MRGRQKLLMDMTVPNLYIVLQNRVKTEMGLIAALHPYELE